MFRRAIHIEDALCTNEIINTVNKGIYFDFFDVAHPHSNTRGPWVN